MSSQCARCQRWGNDEGWAALPDLRLACLGCLTPSERAEYDQCRAEGERYRRLAMDRARSVLGELTPEQLRAWVRLASEQLAALDEAYGSEEREF